MNFRTATTLFSSFFKTMGYLFMFIAFVLFFDSKYMLAVFSQSQHLATVFMVTGYLVVFYRVSARYKEQMIYAVIIGIFGEYFFSVALGMYTYRSGSVPYYVPPGHALVLIGVIYFCKESIVKKHRKKLEQAFTIFIIVCSLLFLVFAKDVFGFIMSMLVLFFLRNRPRERLFYLSKYIVVVYLEIIGTSYQSWSWPDTAFGVFPFLESANPPSGISLFYFLLDLSCLWLYKQRHIIAWKRMKKIRKLREG